MNREASTLAENVKQDSVEKIDAGAMRNSGRNTSQLAGTKPKRNLGDRIKGLFANVAKALEGDHGSQHYRG